MTADQPQPSDGAPLPDHHGFAATDPPATTFHRALAGTLKRHLHKQQREALPQAVARINARYRSEDRASHPLVTDTIERVAYLTVRAPATHAAVREALRQLSRISTGLNPTSVLDLGAGAGAAAWAAQEACPTVREIHCMERDTEMVRFGRSIAAEGPAAIANAHWHAADLCTGAFPAADLVVMSYALGEVSEADTGTVTSRAWAAAEMAVAIIEPGNRRGFAAIRLARQRLIAAGATIVAPCPHQLPCPIVDPDWCHFSTHVPRTGMNHPGTSRRPGQDHDTEKFSYLIAVRDASRAHIPCGRIVRVPLRRAGHVILDVCTRGELRRATYSRKLGETYRAARKSSWGDAWQCE